MPKTFPDPNVHEVPQDTTIIEPKKDDKGKLHCPLCDGVYDSREDYISHALARHQPAILNCDKKGCTSK